MITITRGDKSLFRTTIVIEVARGLTLNGSERRKMNRSPNHNCKGVMTSPTATQSL